MKKDGKYEFNNGPKDIEKVCQNKIRIKGGVSTHLGIPSTNFHSKFIKLSRRDTQASSSADKFCSRTRTMPH